ncbi:glycoside hydrolase family 61 protein [Zalerion maritima]|uniref:lytic cellulose monooxygenase (C4-dehydrogenating) n=1 Tax=Zalerion maritima TaxID=339359 RepID=A0AAD5RJ47_9PEZI|nr:glycoside hydrolase family 61 protein [Zalerion maritima]
MMERTIKDKTQAINTKARNQSWRNGQHQVISNPQTVRSINTFTVPFYLSHPKLGQTQALGNTRHGPPPNVKSIPASRSPKQTKTILSFFTISPIALIDPSSDLWAPNVLMDNDFSWQVTIPSDISSENYARRHEIIALHAAGQENGAQAYPFWVLATESYRASDPGIKYDLFTRHSDVDDHLVPGPPMYPSSNLIINNRQPPPAIATTGTGVESLELAAPAPSPSPTYPASSN